MEGMIRKVYGIVAVGLIFRCYLHSQYRYCDEDI